MRRFTMGANDVLDREGRDEILRSIAEARTIAGDVDMRLASLPAWVLAPGSPLGEDAKRLTDAARARRENEAAVFQIERRLSSPGPIWPLLSVEEKAALDAWIGAISAQNDVLGRYMPTETEKDIRKLILAAIGVTALFGPLFWTEDIEPKRKPLVPITPPEWLSPRPRPGLPPLLPPPAPTVLPPAAAVRPPLPPYRPAPPTARPPLAPPPPGAPVAAAPIRPEDLMRIPVPISPFQGVGPGAAAVSPIREVSPGVFRPASGAVPAARPLAPLSVGPGTPVYPRFQRT